MVLLRKNTKPIFKIIFLDKGVSSLCRLKTMQIRKIVRIGEDPGSVITQTCSSVYVYVNIRLSKGRRCSEIKFVLMS